MEEDNCTLNACLKLSIECFIEFKTFVVSQLEER